jgi:hypothetical protein
MQSLFEASMYTFVFLWTPAINPFANHLPHGMIFACFMTASMVGRLHCAGLQPPRRAAQETACPPARPPACLPIRLPACPPACLPLRSCGCCGSNLLDLAPCPPLPS